MTQTGIAKGRTRVRYGYSRFGWTRGGGKVWHGGSDEELLDDKTFYMPYYKGKSISGTVTRARIVTDRSNPTWEWGYYVCVQLDANQTPDAVNFLYFCHASKLLVQQGQQVRSGDALGIMGNSGNAALADPPFEHVHFEVRATATGTGLDPTAYTGHANAVGTYGSAEEDAPAEDVSVDKLDTIQLLTVGPLTVGEAAQVAALAGSMLLGADRYSMLQVDAAHFAATMTVSNGDAMQFLALAQRNGWDKLQRYHSRFVG